MSEYQYYEFPAIDRPLDDDEHDFTSEDEAGEYDSDDDAEALMSAIVGVRAELAAGDLRPLYLAWLAAPRRRETL